MKRLKNIYRRQISEHCGDPLAHPEYDTENVKMNYNDYEGRMAKQNLYKLHKYSGELFEMLHDHQEMESWVQEKIAKAADYIASVKHYLDYEMIPIENLIGKKGKNQKLMSDVELKDISYYACEDSDCLLYTSPSPRDLSTSRMPSSA